MIILLHNIAKFYFIKTLNYVLALSRSEDLEQVQIFTNLIKTLNYVLALSRSEDLEQVQIFTHLIKTLRLVPSLLRTI